MTVTVTVNVNVTVCKPHRSEPNISLLHLDKVAKRIQTHENKKKLKIFQAETEKIKRIKNIPEIGSWIRR